MRRRALLLLPAIALCALAAPQIGLANEGGAKKPTALPPYMRLPILTATIRQRGGKRGVMSVETGLDVADPKLRALAEVSGPRLRAAFFQVLQTYANGLAPGSPPNPDFLARELQRETDQVLGAKGAKLLLGSILMN